MLDNLYFKETPNDTGQSFYLKKRQMMLDNLYFKETPNDAGQPLF